ncbi:beta-lactamase family protein [bacterium]|nr:beta-lactamase family protein [bacterium]
MKSVKHLTILLFLATFVLILSATRQAASQSGAPYSQGQLDEAHQSAINQAQEILRGYMAEAGVPGITAAASVGGRIVWAEGFGYADVENRVPVWPHTKMRIGSVSKSLTSAAIGLLYQQTKLDLDAPIQKYVPSFPQKRWPITTRQVAGHIAGIRHYRDQEFLSSRYYQSVLDGLTIFKRDTLLFQPGDKYSYSSYGWNLVSAVIEGASGQDFLTYMRENVFEPLGMRNTLADHTSRIIYNRTRFYARSDETLINAPFVDNSYKWAGGGYLSTAGDLIIFANAMIDAEFLKPETVELLFTSLKTTSGERTNYGLGWRLSEVEGERVVGHGGGSVGGTTVLMMIPDKKVVLAVISNLSGARLREPCEKILKLFAAFDS